MRKRVFFISANNYSDFNRMIERYEQEMRRIFEQKQRIAGFEEPAVKTAVYPEDAPKIPPVQEQENTAVLKPEEKISSEEENKTGKIIAEVTTGGGAIPLLGVTVVIDRLDPDDPKGRKELIAIETTDRSGRTKPVEVLAVERDLSLEPGNSDPFTIFYVTAETAGYEPVKDRPVDVFADEISILKIDLVPKPEKLSGGENF